MKLHRVYILIQAEGEDLEFYVSNCPPPGVITYIIYLKCLWIVDGW